MSRQSGVSRDAPPVTCVVLNYNGAADTIACVRSLLVQDYPALHITLVDNLSTDDSLAQLRTTFPQIEIISAGANHGFAAGCNAGIAPALAGRSAGPTPAFVWLLNNDTVAPPDTLSQLVATAAQQPQAGIIGTVLRYMHAPDRVQAWGGGRVQRWSGYGTHFLTPTVFDEGSFLTFASALIRAEVFARIGLLDEGYFMYCEDSDFCFRAREAGFGFAVAPGTAVLHKEGGSSPTRSRFTDRITTASGMRFLARQGRPRWFAPWVYLASRLAKRLLRFDLAALRSVLRGVADWRHETPRAFQVEAGAALARPAAEARR